MLKINKKSIKIAVISIVAVIAAVLIIVFVVKAVNNHNLKQPIELNLNDYIVGDYLTDNELSSYNSDNDYDEDEYSTYFYENDLTEPALWVNGYSNYGEVSDDKLYNVIDWTRLKNDFAAKMSEKKGYEGTGITAFLTTDDFQFTIDKNEQIKNGDTLTVNVSTSRSSYGYGPLTLKINGATKSYTISTLQEVNAFDPFSCIDVMTVGANNHASADCVVKDGLNAAIENSDGLSLTKYSNDCVSVIKNDYIIAKIHFDINSNGSSKLSNGDIISVTCSCDEYSTLLNDYKLYIASFEKKYTVSNLGEYISKDFALSSEDLEMFKADTLNRMNSSYGDNFQYTNFQFSDAYLCDPKDTTSDNSTKNKLYIVFKYNYQSWWANETETNYYCVEYVNLIGSNNKIQYSAEDYYSSRASYSSVEEAIKLEYNSEKYNYKKL